MLNRAMQLLTSVEKGTTLGAALQTLLAADGSLKGELLMAVNLKGIARRCVLADAIMTAFALSDHAADVLFASPQAVALIGTVVSSPTRALAAILAQDNPTVKYMALQAGYDHYVFTNPTYLCALATRMNSVLASSANAFTRPAFFGNVACCKAALDANVQGTNLNLNYVHNNDAGTYITRFYNNLKIAEGLGSDATLVAGIGTSLSVLASTTTYSAAMKASVNVMNAVGDSTTARVQLSTASTWFTGIDTSMALAKYWAGSAGVDPRTIANLAAMGANNTILTWIQADANSCTKLANMPAALLDELFAVANFRTFVGTSGAIWDAIKVVEQAISKYIAVAAGVSTTGITSYATLNVTGTWNSIGASVAAKLVLWNADAMLTNVKGSATAIASLKAAAGAAIFTNTENGTTAVAITGPVSAGKYVVLGASNSNTSARTVTYATKRAGTAIANPALSAVSSTAAADANTAGMPLTAPITAALNGTATGTLYTHLLRCDV